MAVPAAVKVAALPAQMVGDVIVNAGNGLTVTVRVAVLTHPAELVPVTVYMVVMVGLTVTLLPVKLPGIQA